MAALVGEEGGAEIRRSNDHIKQALELIYDPKSSNDERNEATKFLEQYKSRPECAQRGVFLASATDNAPILRHYGLSLLEYFIKYRVDTGSPRELSQLCSWIFQLACGTTDQDASFLRNKTAQLWAELAEQVWLTAWPDMDKDLLQLWQGSSTHQMLVLHILETMSDEVFSTEDKTKDIREPALARACVEIVTPTAVLMEESKQAEEIAHLKSGPEGWYERLLLQLQSCAGSVDHGQLDLTRRILAVLRTITSWITRAAIARSDGMRLLFKCLEAPNITVQMASLEVLHVIYHRRNLSSDLVQDLISPALNSQQVAALRSVRASAEVDVDDLDETKYLFSKKFSEVMCGLGTIALEHPAEIIATTDLPSFLAFTIDILQDASLVVSIPVLYLWTQLLASNKTLDPLLHPYIRTLLEICSGRTIRYEMLPPQYEDDTIRFLNEDFETLPEKHAFVGNYRRFCSDIVEKIVKQNPFDAMKHIIGQADGILSSIEENEKSFDPDQYQSQSMYYSHIEAQATVVTTAGKGYASWLKEQRADTGRLDHVHNQLLQDLEAWCFRLLQVDVKDPSVLRRLLQLVLDITLAAFSPQSRFPLTICEKVLTYDLSEASQSAPYQEALQELKYVSCRIVRKLAQKSPDIFMSIFSEFQQKITEVLARPNVDDRTKEDYKAILLAVVLQASTLDDQERKARLHDMIEPTINKWQDPNLTSELSSFESFCRLLGLDQAARYLYESNAYATQDWANATLSADGQQLRDNLFQNPTALPLFETRALIGASSDKVQAGSNAYLIAEEQWRSAIPAILPNLLQLLSHVHTFSNPERFSSYPVEIQQIIQRSLVDRVWQSGISSESRDDFYQNIRNSKSTFEGLASAMRSSIRTVRELSYWILHCMATFGNAFFGHQDLPNAIAQALYSNAHTLSSHQLSILLKLSTALLEGCPPESASHFLPPLLSGLFGQLDRKIMDEWQRLDATRIANTEETFLAQEMKSESILRVLTNSTVNIIASLTKAADPANVHTQSRNHPMARRIALSEPQVLEPLLLFLTHVLRVRDHRSCSNAVKVLLHQLLPIYRHGLETSQAINSSINDISLTSPNSSSVTSTLKVDSALCGSILSFFATEILKASVTSLHDGSFADTHREIASLIGGILHVCTPTALPENEDTPRALLLSLPSMSATKVDSALSQIRNEASEKQQGRLVMSLLEGLRGVSIYELGKLDLGPRNRLLRSEKSGIAERYARLAPGAAREEEQGGGMDIDEAANIQRGNSPVEGDMNRLFG